MVFQKLLSVKQNERETLTKIQKFNILYSLNKSFPLISRLTLLIIQINILLILNHLLLVLARTATLLNLRLFLPIRNYFGDGVVVGIHT